MKFLFSLICVSFCAASLFAEEKVFVYLIDPDDQKTLGAFAEDEWNPFPPDPIDPNLSSKSKTTPAKTTNSLPAGTSLDDLLDGLSKKGPLSKSHERILKEVEAEQRAFITEIDRFLKTSFDARDDQVHGEFNQIRKELVRLVFEARSERAYYERLYLINKIYLENPTEGARFLSLDRALRDRWLELEERSRRYRQIILGVSALGGAVGGGWLSYKISQKVIPVVATDKSIASIGKWIGRATIIFIGAGVGAAAGQYIGFLGSDYLFRRRDYIDPIDGSQELRDILDVIATLP